MKIAKLPKSIVSVLLTVLLVFSMFTAAFTCVSAANVELEPSGFKYNGGYFYFDNTTTKWSNTYIYLVVGNTTNSNVYLMSPIANTNYYFCNRTGNDGLSASYIGIVGTDAAWTSGNWNSSNLKNASHYTAAYSGSYEFNSGDTYILSPDSNSNGCTITPTYYTTNYVTTFNRTVTVKEQTAENGSTTYSDSAVAASISAKSYKFTANDAVSATSSSITKGAVSGSTTLDAAKTTKVTLSYSGLTTSDYVFKGWYKSGSSIAASTSSTFTFTCTGDVTYYARFEKALASYHVSARPYTNGRLSKTGGSTSTLGTTVVAGETFTVTAEAAEGYTFDGWFSDSKLTKKLSSETTYSVVVNEEFTLYASFVLNDWYISGDGFESDVKLTRDTESETPVFVLKDIDVANFKNGEDNAAFAIKGDSHLYGPSSDNYDLTNLNGYSATLTVDSETSMVFSNIGNWTKADAYFYPLTKQFVLKDANPVLVTAPDSVSITVNDVARTITAVAVGGSIGDSTPAFYTYTLYKDGVKTATNTSGIFSFEKSEEEAVYTVTAAPGNYILVTTESEEVIIAPVTQLPKPILTLSSSYVAPGESFTIKAQLSGYSGITFALYDNSDNLLQTNKTGTFTVTASDTEGNYSYYVKATLNDLESVSERITVTVSGDTSDELNVQIYFKSTDSYGYETYAKIGNNAKVLMIKAAADESLSIPENLGKNKTQTATYYWYKTDVTLKKGEEVSILFTANRYNLNASIKKTFKFSGAYFFGADDLNNATTAVDLSNVSAAQRNWVQSANHMVYNPLKDDPITSTGANVKYEVLGDADGDGRVTILDVTLIQKDLAGLTTFTGAQNEFSDYNGDGIISILDATAIQKMIAKI